MLAEYPGHIVRLQQALDRFASIPSAGVGPFDQVIWTLEGLLETFFHEASEDLEKAQASGDTERISAAKTTLDIMSRAFWKHVWIGDEALYEYIQKYKDVLQ